MVHAFRELGLDVEALCREIDVPLAVFLNTDARLPRDALGRLWRAASMASRDRFLGLHAAQVWRARADHLVMLLLTSAETLGAGIEASTRYQELLAHGRVVTLGEHPEHHAVQINRIEHELPITIDEIEFLAATVTKMFRFATDGRFVPREVQLEHAYRGQIQQYTRTFGSSVTFGHGRTAIIADDEAWNLPLTHASPALHTQLRGVAAGLHSSMESHAFIDTVRDRIRALFPRGQPSIEAVAASLHMTPRTLQRRLQDDGTTFRALVDAIRRSILVQAVERNQAPTEMMRQAGYTNLRSFRRALKRWHLPDLSSESGEAASG